MPRERLRRLCDDTAAHTFVSTLERGERCPTSRSVEKLSKALEIKASTLVLAAEKLISE